MARQQVIVVSQVGRHATVRRSKEEMAAIIVSAVDSVRPDTKQMRSLSGTSLFTSVRERRRAIQRDLAGAAHEDGDLYPTE